MSTTLQEVLERQQALIAEASLTIPGSFHECTYNRGYIRQPVYLCKTCDTPSGICHACSVACHTDHEQLELFAKRNFRCDCSTTAISHACSLVSPQNDLNTENTYNHNFYGGGQFCRCGRDYDVKTERETMVQCLACEDWYHESCLNLRDRPSESSLEQVDSSEEQNTLEETESTCETDTESISDPTLPPTRLKASRYESLVCKDCVLGIPILARWAGTPGVLMIIRDASDNSDSRWTVIGSGEEEEEVTSTADAREEGDATGKRRLINEEGTRYANKKQRLEDNGLPCLAPAPNLVAQSLLNSLASQTEVLTDSKLVPVPSLAGAGDIFLTSEFRKRWCHCSFCSANLSAYPYLLTEEETYEPPEDPDANLSFEELGMRALASVPRDQAIDGIVAYNQLRDELKAYLLPFAQGNRLVADSDIKAFFDMKERSKDSATVT